MYKFLWYYYHFRRYDKNACTYQSVWHHRFKLFWYLKTTVLKNKNFKNITNNILVHFVISSNWAVPYLWIRMNYSVSSMLKRKNSCTWMWPSHCDVIWSESTGNHIRCIKENLMNFGDKWHQTQICNIFDCLSCADWKLDLGEEVLEG